MSLVDLFKKYFETQELESFITRWGIQQAEKIMEKVKSKVYRR